jgi:RNA polymerase sigma-70 factor, sigma-B/F/G subfamily
MSNNEQSPRASSRLRTQLPLKKSKRSIRDKQKTKELFKRYKETGDEQAREQLVLAHLNLARFLASKFKNRGESLDDLVQVATIGLIKAIDRFDISRGLEFTTYATPTIMGEIKRHFRDKGWSVRVPRRLQELSAKVTQVSDKLTEKLQRSPSVDEIAQALGVSVDEVLEAMESAHAYTSVSLDVPQGDDDDGTQSSTVIDKYALVDEDLESSDDRIVLEQAIKDFSEREQQIIRMRFLEGFTQVEIAQKLQISQVQVSRLLRKTLQKFQEKLDPNHVMEHANSQSS